MQDCQWVGGVDITYTVNILDLYNILGKFPMCPSKMNVTLHTYFLQLSIKMFSIDINLPLIILQTQI